MPIATVTIHAHAYTGTESKFAAVAWNPIHSIQYCSTTFGTYETHQAATKLFELITPTIESEDMHT